MKLTSTAFNDGGVIPGKYTGTEQDISPPLSWSDSPVATKSFALICDDPDAPSRAKPRPDGPWVHWLIFNIPADVTELPEGLTRTAELDVPEGTRQGKNDFSSDNVGYRGPMPPEGSGPHRYYFKLYALDQHLELSAQDANKQSLIDAMQNHILAEAQFIGTFERS